MGSYNRTDQKRLTNFGQRAFLSRGKGLAWGMSGTTWPAGGKLAQAIGYEHTRKSMRADVGWLSKSAARIGAKFQEGDRTTGNEKRFADCFLPRGFGFQGSRPSSTRPGR